MMIHPESNGRSLLFASVLASHNIALTRIVSREISLRARRLGSEYNEPACKFGPTRFTGPGGLKWGEILPGKKL